MENMQNFIGWIIIIFGVLQIILFFKIWIMTDDVTKIKIQFKQMDTLMGFPQLNLSSQWGI